MTSHHASATTPIPIATRDQFAAQLPTLIAHRRHEPEASSATSSSTVAGAQSQSAGSKRKHAETKKKDQTRRIYEHDQTNLEEMMTETHKLPPSFAIIPNQFMTQTPANATTTAKSQKPSSSSAASTSTTTLSTTRSPTTRFFNVDPITTSKKGRKALTQDYSDYMNSVNQQAMRILSETIPRSILRLNELGEEFNTQLKANDGKAAAAAAAEVVVLNKSSSSVTASISAAASSIPAVMNSSGTTCASTFQFAAPVVAALEASAKKAGTPADVDNVQERLQTGKEEDDKPITALFQHKPPITASYPALSSLQTHHGWNFYQLQLGHPTDQFIRDWIHRLQAELSDLVSIIAILKLSFTLALPSALDTNNTEAEILEEFLIELKDQAVWCNNLSGRLTNYFEQRAEILSKCYKYPGVKDYQQSIQELDEYIRITIRSNWMSLRNSYMWIRELYLRNEEKFQLDSESMSAFHSMI